MLTALTGLTIKKGGFHHETSLHLFAIFTLIYCYSGIFSLYNIHPAIPFFNAEEIFRTKHSP